jgi:hypothetical protein
MKSNEEVFRSQYQIVSSFIKHYIYYREMYDLYNKMKLQSELLTLTIDSHILQAAILWCMIFGSHGDQNQLHWKKISDNMELQNRFREILFHKTDFDEKSWEKYWKDMVYFRNNYAAHREINYKRPVPKFQKALEVAYAYDEWIREIFTKPTEEEGVQVFPYLDEQTFEELVEQLKETVVPLFDLLLKQVSRYNKKNYLNV